MATEDQYGGFQISSGQAATAPAPTDEYEGFKISTPAVQRREERRAQEPPRRPTTSATPTMYQTARAPAVPGERELTAEETARGFVRNIVPSTVEAGRATLEALTSPVQTFQAVKQLGTGALSKARGALGMQQDAAEAAKDEQLLDAFVDQYRNTYGSRAGFKRALAEDPASVLMDLSTFITGGATAAGKAGMISDRAMKVAQRAGSMIDPMQAAIKVAKAPVVGARIPGTETRIPGVAQAVPYLQALSTGASPESIKIAARVGLEGTEKQRAAFLRSASKPANDYAILDAAEEALEKLKDKRSADYLAGMKRAKQGQLPDVDLTNVFYDFEDAFNKNRFTDPKTGFVDVRDPVVDEMLMEIRNKIEKYGSEPVGSAARSLEGIDALKRSINVIRSRYRTNPEAYQKATALYNSVLRSITDASPEYGRVMSEYGQISDEISRIRAGLGVGTKLSDEAILRRLMGKRTGRKGQLIDQLSEFNDELPHMLAGAELREYLPGGLRQALNYLGAAPMAIAVHPLAAAGQLAAASPKLAGRLAYGAGRLGAAGRAVTQPAVVTPAYYAGRAQEEQFGQEGKKPEDDVFDRMLMAESNNRQFDSQGNTVMGPEVDTEFGRHRAVGAAQVMPYTGPEAAEAAGLPWDEQRLATDEEYNKQLGRAYYEKQLAAFNDPVAAAAAYNAGPGRVRDAMRKAEESGGSFVDFLPAETKDYLRKIFGESAGEFRIERRSGGRVNNVERLVSQLMLRTKQAKRETTKATEPLLDQPDESIVRALDVAQQAI